MKDFGSTFNWKIFEAVTAMAAVAALVVSLGTYWLTVKNQKQVNAANECRYYFLGPDLKNDFEKWRNSINKSMYDKDFSRARGNIFNALNILALQHRADVLDKSIFKACFESELKKFCDFSIYSRTHWNDLRQIAVNQDFWGDDYSAMKCAAFTLGYDKKYVVPPRLRLRSSEAY